MTGTKETVEAAKDVVEAVERTAELAADQIEETALKAVPFFKNRYFIIGAVALTAAAAGAGVTYLVLNKKLEAKYVAISETEIAEARERYSMLRKEGMYESPEAAAEALGVDVADPPTPVVVEEMVAEELNYAPPKQNVRPEQNTFQAPPVVNNIFTDKGVIVESDGTEIVHAVTDEFEEVWDYEHEKAKRDPMYPYIIHEDEYMENEDDYEQQDMTYYEGDDVLADHNDKVVPNVEDVIGVSHLERFGYGSSDNNTVYIRNQEMMMDFEVSRSAGSYTVEVLGLDHIEEVEDERPRKFRMNDSS